MTKQEIIETICANWVKDEKGIPFMLDQYKVADELLAKIEQEKKEQARDILNEITKPVNTLTRLGFTQYILYQNDIDKLAKEYGVEL